ncbi:MAG: ABC transporter substrate-binding protein [Flavobacteriaceae bacterium]
MNRIFSPILSLSTLAIVFLVFGASCASKIDIDQTSVFRYNEFRNITSLDPAFARNPQNIWPIQQVFNGLVQLDNELNVIPEIAKQWSIDSLGTTYTFHLRSDVYFHPAVHFGAKQTRPVVASDFVYSFDRLLDKNIGSPGGWVLQQVEHYNAVNDSVFQIKLKQAFPAFIGLLSMRYCAVVPREVLEDNNHDFRKHPIGTGPFLFKTWEEDVKLVLRRNPSYFERDDTGKQLPHLEAIAISFLPDIQSEFMQFTQGKFDFLNSLDPSYKDELLTPDGFLQSKYKEKLNVQRGPYLNTEYIGLYLESKNPAIHSKEIRKAINIGFDRNKMIHYLRNTIGFPADKGFIPKGLVGHSSTTLNQYQPDVARALVSTYIERQQEIPQIRLATDINYLDICEYLQRELEKIGLKIIIELMPTSTLRQAKSAGKLEAFRASWIADYPDAENYLSLFYSQNFSPKGPNYTHFKNDLFDTLYRRSMVKKSLVERGQLYQKMDEIIMENNPVIPLYYDEAIRFIQNDIVGLEMNPLNLLVLKKVRKIKH